MPIRKVRLPNGSVVNINAPERATDDQIMGYAHDQIWSTMPASKLPKPPPGLPKATPGTPWSTTIKGAAGHYLGGVIGHWTDEVSGVGEVARNAAKALVGAEPLNTDKAWAVGKRNQRKAEETFRRDHSTGATALGGAGMAGSLILPGLAPFRASKAATLAAKATTALPRLSAKARVGNAMVTGGAYGTALGLGEGEGADRLIHAAEGGVGGALIGGAMHPLAKGATVGARALRRVPTWISQRAADKWAKEVAERKLSTTMANAGHTPEQAATIVQTRQAQGVPASLSDSSDAARQLTGHTSRGSGPGQTLVRDAIRTRQANMAARAREHIDQSLGSTVDPHAQSASLTEQGRLAAKPLYDEAYQQPVTMTAALQEFAGSPVGGRVLKDGMENLSNIPAVDRALGSEAPTRAGYKWSEELGGYTDAEVPVLEAWDGAKRGLDDLEFQTNSPFQTNPQGMTSDTRAIDLRRKQLLSELDAQVPAYAEARKAYAGPIQERAAFEAGLETSPGSSRNNANDVRALTSRMNPGQLGQFKLGDRTRLADKVYGDKNGPGLWADATAPLIGNDARRSMIAEIHGAEAAEKLFGKADAERQAHLTYKAVDGNSSTAERLAFDDDQGGGATIKAMGHLVTGHPFSALQSAIAGVKDWTQAPTKEALAPMLTDMTPDGVEGIVKRLHARTAKDDLATYRYDNRTRNAARLAPFAIVGQSGDDRPLEDDPYAQGR